MTNLKQKELNARDGVMLPVLILIQWLALPCLKSLNGHEREERKEVWQLFLNSPGEFSNSEKE